MESKSDNSSNYSGSEILNMIEGGLQNYNKDIVTKLIRGAKDHCKLVPLLPVLDFGAGRGTLAEIWRDSEGVSPICLEIDLMQRQICIEQGFQTYDSLGSMNSDFSIIYSSNVLEHIEDDVAILLEINQHMKPGALLAVYVPAIPFLYSDLDAYIGHFRRYKRQELIEKVTKAGFLVKSCYFNDSLGVLASIFVRIFGWEVHTLARARRLLIFYDKVFYPISKLLDYFLLHKIIGKNLFLFAVKD